jgi:hypothetical protein
MSTFVDGHHAAVVVGHLMTALFGTHLNAGDGVQHQLLIDLLAAGTGSQDSSLVHHVLQVGAGGEGRALGQHLQVDIVSQRLRGDKPANLMPSLQFITHVSEQSTAVE